MPAAACLRARSGSEVCEKAIGHNEMILTHDALTREFGHRTERNGGVPSGEDHATREREGNSTLAPPIQNDLDVHNVAHAVEMTLEGAVVCDRHGEGERLFELDLCRDVSGAQLEL
jgi:hypothetical protein